MFDAHLLPLLATESGGAVRSRSVNVFGLKEAEIDDLLRGMIDPSGNPSVGVTAQGAVVKVRAEVQAADPEEAVTALDDFEREVRARLEDNAFGTDSDTLESAVGRALIGKGFTLSLAESCTGGLIGHKLTNVSGISQSFLMGVVAYRNEIKTDLLGVPEDLIAAHGAVSEEVARAMASGVRRAADSDYGLSVTGIAGPTGGSPEKPVGTVFIGLDGPNGTVARRHKFSGDRQDIKEKTANAALDLLRRAL
jgi:nicotinamide-nucleotide amidase